MKKILAFLLLLIPALFSAQTIQPRFYAGLTLPKHSYLPSGEVPKRSYNPGFTVGAQINSRISENSIAFILGLNYAQKGGIISYANGNKFETRFNTVGMEFGMFTDHANGSLWNEVNMGAGFTAAYLLNGNQTATVGGITSSRSLSIGKEAPDDLFQLSIGFKLYLNFNLGKHFDLGLTYQGSFNELDLVNKNNMRDKGLEATLGYWIFPVNK